MSDEPLIVTMSHIRKAHICAQGAREFWRRRGWDWPDFLENGIAADRLVETGDALALRVVEVARG